MAFRRLLRLPLGAAAPSPPPPSSWPTPDFELDSDDVIVDGSNALTSWPAVHGPNLSATSHLAYSTGPTANGHLGIIGQVPGSRLSSTSVVKAGTTNTKWTWWGVFDPDDILGLGDRRYLYYLWANETSSANHWVRTHIVNVGGPIPFNRIGHYVGQLGVAGWQSIAGVGSLRDRHFLCITYDGTIGETNLYQNGTLVGTLVGTPITGQKVEAPVIFSSYETTDAPINQWFTGSFYGMADYYGFVATPTQVADKYAELKAKYDIVDAPFFPSDIPSCVGWYNEGGKLGPASAMYNGTVLAQQDNQATTSNLLSYSGGVSDGGIANRPNGIQFNVFNGTDGFGSNGPLGDMITTSAYYQSFVFRIRSCSTSGGAAYSLENIACDASGYCWKGINNNGGTSFDLKFGHWDGSEKNLTIPGLSYNTWYRVEGGYDGTNIVASLNGVAQTPVAAGNIPGAALAQPYRISRSAGSAYAKLDLACAVFCNAYPNSTDRSNLSTYLSTRYGV